MRNNSDKKGERRPNDRVVCPRVVAAAGPRTRSQPPTQTRSSRGRAKITGWRRHVARNNARPQRYTALVERASWCQNYCHPLRLYSIIAHYTYLTPFSTNVALGKKNLKKLIKIPSGPHVSPINRVHTKLSINARALPYISRVIARFSQSF